MGRTSLGTIAGLTLLLAACASGPGPDRATGADGTMTATAPGTPTATTPRTATATLVDGSGREVGTARLVQTPNHGVLIRLEARGLTPGDHAFHIHETGQCTAPDFQSAGGHFSPRHRAHGLHHPDGMHGGDMPNVTVPTGGVLTIERLAQQVSLVPGDPGFLFDEDGSALVIHAGADDYRSQPSGDAGGRVACGVIR